MKCSPMKSESHLPKANRPDLTFGLPFLVHFESLPQKFSPFTRGSLLEEFFRVPKSTVAVHVLCRFQWQKASSSFSI